MIIAIVTHYETTQKQQVFDLFRKNPNLLAKYIRESTQWIVDQEHSSPAPEEVQSLYATLWGATSNIHIQFNITNPDRANLEMGEVLHTITQPDLNEHINRLRRNTAPRLDGIKRKHIAEQHMRELLRILFNIIMVSKAQPTAWNSNTTILIPKEEKDHSK
jgi:hypothetical protein